MLHCCSLTLVLAGGACVAASRLAVDGFLNKALGKHVRGKPFGGGRARAGGFEIDLGFLATDHGDREEHVTKWQLFDKQIRRRIFYAAGLDSEKWDELE